jgi:hypothetical protein
MNKQIKKVVILTMGLLLITASGWRIPKVAAAVNDFPVLQASPPIVSACQAEFTIIFPPEFPRCFLKFQPPAILAGAVPHPTKSRIMMFAWRNSYIIEN